MKGHRLLKYFSQEVINHTSPRTAMDRLTYLTFVFNGKRWGNDVFVDLSGTKRSLSHLVPNFATLPATELPITLATIQNLAAECAIEESCTYDPDRYSI